MTGETIKVGNVRLHYSLSGPEDGPVICLNHCFAADHRYWDRHLAAFEGFRILRHDARGHGRSDVPPGPYSLAMMAYDLLGLLDALEIDRVHLCGVSMGGMIAQTAAIKTPDRFLSLALVNTTCEYDDDQIRGWRERGDQVLREGVAPLKTALMERWFTADAAKRRIPGYVYMEERIARFPARSFAAIAAAMSDLHTTDGLTRLRMPSIVIATKDDPGVPTQTSELMARKLGVTPHWIGPARHLATLEQPDQFNTRIREFLLSAAKRR